MWPALTAALDELRRGDGRVLLSLADLYDERGPDGHYDNTQEAFTAILCQDQERTTDRAVVADTNRRANAAAPFTDPGRGAGRRAGRVRVLAGAADRRARTRRRSRACAPTLVVSTTGDPATPYQAGVDLARQLGGRLLTFEGTQHTAALHGDRASTTPSPPTSSTARCPPRAPAARPSELPVRGRARLLAWRSSSPNTRWSGT